MGGLRVTHGKNNSAILDIPTKDRGLLKFFTSLSGMKEFAEHKRKVMYFNPRSDFADKHKEVELDG